MFLMIFVPYFVHSRFCYFSTDLRMSFSYSSFNLSVLMQRVQRNLAVDPLRESSASYCFSYESIMLFSKVSFASLIS